MTYPLQSLSTNLFRSVANLELFQEIDYLVVGVSNRHLQLRLAPTAASLQSLGRGFVYRICGKTNPKVVVNFSRRIKPLGLAAVAPSKSNRETIIRFDLSRLR